MATTEVGTVGSGAGSDRAGRRALGRAVNPGWRWGRRRTAVVLLVGLVAGAGPIRAQGPSWSGGAGAGPGSAQAAQDRGAILEVVRTLFDGMREKDEGKLRSVFHPDARLHSAAAGPEGTPATRETPIDGFIQGVLGSDAYLDEVTFDEEVRIDGNLAMAWTPYNLFVDGAFQHCGVDVFVLTRSPEGWLILQIADTRRRDGCDPGRRG